MWVYAFLLKQFRGNNFENVVDTSKCDQSWMEKLIPLRRRKKSTTF